MPTLDEFAARKLDALETRHLRRVLIETDRVSPVDMMRDGRRLISFCCNDYLNLSQHPDVKRAAIEATERYGVGAGASRLVTGNHPLFRELEERLARLKRTEDACVFGSGYLANLGIIPSLVGPDDLIVADELSHACLLAGAKLSGAALQVFRHNETLHLEQILQSERDRHPHALIVTDGVFSMDGDLAPLNALGEISARYDTWLMTDDAHGVGVVGGGRGSSFIEGVTHRPPLQMGTLSKAIGSYGGYLCASKAVVDLIRTRARTLIYSTGLPPGAVAASIAALDLIERDTALVSRPMSKAALFAAPHGLPTPQSCIVPIVLGAAERALAASALLEEEGFLVTAIRPPTVPAGTARLRFTFSAAHRDEDILRLASLVKTQILDG